MTDLSNSASDPIDRHAARQVIDESWVEVCAIEDIPFDAGIAALINENTAQEAQIALFRPLDSDTVYAVGNFDPFSAANVLGRGILCSIGQELAVASPVFKQHFSLATGRCFEDTAVAIPAYPVKVRDGMVFVRVSAASETSW